MPRKPGDGSVEIVIVEPHEPRFDDVLRLADAVLDQRRYLVREFPAARQSRVVAAFHDAACVGFLRFVVQIIGESEGRPPVVSGSTPLSEGYIEAFGVDPGMRRRGVGAAMQTAAIEQCREAGCYQMRSRSPITSTENYALKLAMGYVLSPSEENDSYYFVLKL